jgi:hypothetical protein
MSRTQKITPMLWFDDNAEEAVNHYVSIFKNSRIENMTRYGEAGPRPKGSVMTIGFELEGQAFTALNWGSALQVFRSTFAGCQLRNSGRSGRTLGQAFRWRAKGAMRLAEGQVRSVLAGGSHGFDRNAARRRRGEIGACHAGDNENG